jgi:hypothetical protein
MLDLTLRFLAWMLSVCTPTPRGRHRLGATAPLRFTPTPSPRFTEPLDGDASHLVRPYVLDETERRHQAGRRRAVRLATPGIDVGPKHTHGVRVPAAAR